MKRKHDRPCQTISIRTPVKQPRDYTRLPSEMPKIIIFGMQKYPAGLEPSLFHGGKISTTEANGFRLSLPSNSAGYCLSQLDDYRGISRRAFKWSPPAKLEIRARASHNSPSGTLGFGFWNDPFTLSLGQGGASLVPSFYP